MRLISKYMNTAVQNLLQYWNDLLWDNNSRRAYKKKLLSNPGSAKLLADHPKLRAAIFYCSYTSTTKVFLVGICKFRRAQDVSSKVNSKERVFVGRYTTSLFQYGDKLCYHQVRASSVEEAKKKVRQADHSCKIHAHARQPVCRNGGMTLAHIKSNSKLFEKLLLSSSQHISYLISQPTKTTT